MSGGSRLSTYYPEAMYCSPFSSIIARFSTSTASVFTFWARSSREFWSAWGAHRFARYMKKDRTTCCKIKDPQQSRVKSLYICCIISNSFRGWIRISPFLLVPAIIIYASKKAIWQKVSHFSMFGSAKSSRDHGLLNKEPLKSTWNVTH